MLKSRQVLVALLALVMVMSMALPLGLVAAQDDEWVTYESEFGFTLEHPADWVVGEDEDGVMLANSQATFDKMESDDPDTNPEAGEVGVLVLTIGLADLGLPEDTELEMLYDMFIGAMTGESMQTLGDPEVLDFDGVEARTVEVSDIDSGSEGLMVLLIDEGALIIVVQVNAAGETADFKETTLMIAASVTFEMGMMGDDDDDAMGDDDDDMGGMIGDVPDLTQSFDSANGISLSYPDGWVAGDDDEGDVMVANSEATFDKMLSDDPDANPVEGEVGIIMVAFGMEDLGLPAGTDLDTVFDIFIGAMTGEGMSLMGETVDLDFDGVPARMVYVSDDESGSDGMLVMFTTDDALLLGIMLTAKDGVAEFEDVALAIIGSATYSAP